MKTGSSLMRTASVLGLLGAIACAGKTGHHRSGDAASGGAGQSATGGSDDAVSPKTGGTSGTGGRGSSSHTGGRTDIGDDAGSTAEGGAGFVGNGGSTPSTSGGSTGEGGGSASETGGGASEGDGGTGGSTGGSWDTGGLEETTGGSGETGGVAGAAAATGGAAGAAPEPLVRVLSEPSPCGGFTPMLIDWFVELPGNGQLPAESYCDAGLLRWACNNTATGGLSVQLTRLEYQCCADLSASLVPEGDAYRLSVTDLAENDCNCVCVFDVQTFVERPCEPTTILWGDQSFALPVEDYSSGELVVSNEASSICTALPSQSSDDIAQAFAGGTATFTVTRTWVRTQDLDPVEAEYAAVNDAPSWTLAFSEDASSVTLSQAGSEHGFTGARLEGDPLIYELSPATGGQLVIVARGSGYSAEVRLYGSGLPVIASYLGELTLES